MSRWGGYHHRHPLLFYLRRHPFLLFYLRRSPLRPQPPPPQPPPPPPPTTGVPETGATWLLLLLGLAGAFGTLLIQQQSKKSSHRDS